MATAYLALTSPADWTSLQTSITSKQSAAVPALIDHLKDVGAVFAIIEREYLDRDFTAEFSAFYSKVFKRHTKICQRIHFFKKPVSSTVASGTAEQVADELESLSESQDYLGFVVVRPIPHAPLGRVCVVAPTSPAGVQSDVLIMTEHRVHLLGAELSVMGCQFTQQDARVGACAQAAIWICGRHYHERHRGPWATIPDITDAASKPTDLVQSQFLPAGSGGLSADSMLRALRWLGREPLVYYSANRDPNTLKYTWGAPPNPAAIIDRYIDSGIPVILGIGSWVASHTIGHAVVATGHTRKIHSGPVPTGQRLTRAVFSDYFLVHDDQLGTHLRMPIVSGAPHGQTPYSLENLNYLIIPLPAKVFVTAEATEVIAWARLEQYCTNWQTMKANYGQQLSNSAVAGDAFVALFNAGQIIARTYLTYGWKYKARIIKNNCASELKEATRDFDLPRYVWVTEFGSATSFNQSDESKIIIEAHCVQDATSNAFWDSKCIFHAPGFIWAWTHDNQNPYGNYAETIIPVPNETPYRMKIRRKT